MPAIGQVARNLTASPQRLTTSSSGSTDSLRLAAYHAKLILGCFRMGDASDPEVYVTAITAVLARYPSDVGARLSDPKDGVAGRFKWLPTVSEIREECDRLSAADVAAVKRQADLTEQMRLRDESLPEVRPSPDPRGEIISDYDAALKRNGNKPPFGAFSKERQLPYRG